MVELYHLSGNQSITIDYMKQPSTLRGSNAFGQWLLGEIRSRGMNQTEFAKRVGASTTTVSRWIAGRIPEGKYMDPIADVLVLDYDLVATKAGYRPAIQEVPTSEREARAVELARRIDWDRDDPSLRLAMTLLEELAETFRKKRDEE
jgi:transcriptional regulator with XRE-family HTH domain